MGNRRKRGKSGQASLLPALIFGGVVLAIVAAGGLIYFIKKKQREDEGTVQSGSNPRFGSGSNSGSSNRSELAQAIAETDKLDPNWRLADIAAQRAKNKLEASRNGALLALSCSRQIPQNSLNAFESFDVRKLPGVPYADADIQKLRNALRGLGPALADAQKIAATPTGRFDINFNFDKPLDTNLDHAANARKTAWLLVHDSLLHSSERDPAGAILDVQATFNLARYLDDEPVLLSQLVRVAINILAIGALERALNCPNVPDDSLKLIQEVLEADGSASGLTTALRGERANFQALIESKNYQNTNLSDADHAWALRNFNRAITLARKGPPYYSPEWVKLTDEIAGGPQAATKLMPHYGKVRDALARQLATLQAATIAVASERYRRATGEWPAELEQLVPGYLRTLPRDPYLGGPFLHQHKANGFSVYVKGPANSASGDFTAIGSGPNQCQGFRILDLPGRH